VSEQARPVNTVKVWWGQR